MRALLAVLLVLAGAVLLTLAAWLAFGRAAGLAVAGVGLLLVGLFGIDDGRSA